MGSFLSVFESPHLWLFSVKMRSKSWFANILLLFEKHPDINSVDFPDHLIQILKSLTHHSSHATLTRTITTPSLYSLTLFPPPSPAESSNSHQGSSTPIGASNAFSPIPWSRSPSSAFTYPPSIFSPTSPVPFPPSEPGTSISTRSYGPLRSGATVSVGPLHGGGDCARTGERRLRRRRKNMMKARRASERTERPTVRLSFNGVKVGDTWD